MKKLTRISIVLIAVLGLLVGAGSALAGNGNGNGNGSSEAEVEVVVSDTDGDGVCDTVDVWSDKDISNVEVFFNDGTSQKFEGGQLRESNEAEDPDGEFDDGGLHHWRHSFFEDDGTTEQNEGVASATAKSGTTRESAECNGGGGQDPECSDGVDNGDPEDELADEEDPGCHTDGDATNPDSYDPDDNDETDEPTGGDAFCRAIVLINPITENVAIANEPGAPCVTGDGDLLDVDSDTPLPIPLTVGQAQTDESNTSATADVVFLDGGDMGSISAVGASDSCADGEDAWILRIHDGDAEALRVSSDDDPNATIGVPGLNDGSAGVFWTTTDDGKAQALVLTDGSDDIIVGSEAEAHCAS